MIVHFSESVLRRIDIRKAPVDRFCWRGVRSVSTTGTTSIWRRQGSRASQKSKALGTERDSLCCQSGQRIWNAYGWIANGNCRGRVDLDGITDVVRTRFVRAEIKELVSNDASAGAPTILFQFHRGLGLKTAIRIEVIKEIACIKGIRPAEGIS